MLIREGERDLIAQHPAKSTSQIATTQLSQVTQRRAIALTCGPWSSAMVFDVLRGSHADRSYVEATAQRMSEFWVVVVREER